MELGTGPRGCGSCVLSRDPGDVDLDAPLTSPKAAGMAGTGTGSDGRQVVKDPTLLMVVRVCPGAPRHPDHGVSEAPATRLGIVPTSWSFWPPGRGRVVDRGRICGSRRPSAGSPRSHPCRSAAL